MTATTVLVDDSGEGLTVQPYDLPYRNFDDPPVMVRMSSTSLSLPDRYLSAAEAVALGQALIEAGRATRDRIADQERS